MNIYLKCPLCGKVETDYASFAAHFYQDHPVENADLVADAAEIVRGDEIEPSRRWFA